ncbi:RDD family protein [Vibrio lentus]|nr:RDD family protein [Vibrio lentus]
MGVAYSLILGSTYYVGMHAKYGQTIGKMVTRVKVGRSYLAK